MRNDEAMCGGHACPLKENCQRYISGLESGGFGYWTMEMCKDGKCEQFKPIKDEIKTSIEYRTDVEPKKLII